MLSILCNCGAGVTAEHKSGKCLKSLGELIYARIDLLARRSQWPRGIRRRSTAARLLRLLVRIPPGAWMLSAVNVVRCQVEVSATHMITRPEESYRLWCVVVCDLETSWMRRPWPSWGRGATKYIYIYIYEIRAFYEIMWRNNWSHTGDVCRYYTAHALCVDMRD